MAVNETTERIIFEGVDRITAASKSAEKSTKELKQTLDGVKEVLGGLGISVGAGAFVKLQLDALHATAALDDMAEATGASVEKLSAIQNVAKVGGHDFEGLTGQIGKMIKGLKDGSEEGGKAAYALDFLGVKAKDANGNFRDTGEVLIDAARALGKYRDDGNKVALIQDILGKGAERYAPLLKDIAQGTDLVSKVTAEQAAKAEEAEKNINRLKITMEDARKELVNEFTPAIIAYTNRVLAAKEGTKGWYETLERLLSVSGNQANDPIAAIEAIDKRLQKLRADQAVLSGPGIGAAFNRMMAPEDLAMLWQQIALAERQKDVLLRLMQRTTFHNMDGMVEDAAGIHVAPDKPQSNYQSPTSGGEKDPRLSPEKIAQMQAAAEEQFNEEVQKWRREQIEATKKYNDELQKSADHYRDLLDPLRKFGREWETLDDLLRKGVISQEEYLDAYVKVAEAADKARLEIEGVSEEAKRSKNAFAEMGFTATSALEEIIFKGGQASDIIRALGQDLAKIFLRKTVFDPLAAGAGKAFEGFFKTPEKASTGDFSAGGGFENVNWLGENASGGNYTVGGRGGTDSQLVAFKATPGERVSVSTPGQGRGSLVIQNGDINIQGEGVTMSQVRQALAVQQRQTLIAVREDRRR
jgi:hypothetical protein